ncbi:uncharacterized protein KY384_000638 [Bacidia gigantensis]|uniref:uncharacterized protein n=1 Tax=Bacidia gigantensis TaxID=2732470 RepID=UPI001D04322F|nr:uncharacterized protein KY384_000638 [Bacidia gigantensis]KAG8525878.1 hypothetical protein KY384_000638 [Bacidia gigantensis]
MSRTVLAAFLALLLPTLVFTHTVITYPGWRGDNLQTNGTIPDENGLGVGRDNTYPYGMQWIYPCGGTPMSANRTKWPVKGGAVGFQPGWFAGHSSALIYINLGEGTQPKNYSLVMQPMIGITGPSNDLYNGSVCLPQLPLPANFTATVGANATIQVIEAAQHGAALFNCVDITFAEPEDVPAVTPDNCSNSSNIKFDFVYSTASLTSDATTQLSKVTWMSALPFAAAIAWGMMA